MRHIIGIITLLLPLTATALWDGQIAPPDALMSEPKVARFVVQPDQWCHYKAISPTLPDFIVGLYPDGPTQCIAFPQYPPDIYYTFLDLAADADALAVLGCPFNYPKTVYLAKLRGVRGLVFPLVADHVVLGYPEQDEEIRRATVSHELAHHHMNAAVGLPPVVKTWYSEAWPVAVQLFLNPGNNAHLLEWAPWSSTMSWGLGNSANPYGRYHLGMFFQYLRNKHGFNLCEWLNTYGATLGTATEYQVWQSINTELGIVGANLDGLRRTWAAFGHYWAMGGTEYTPSVAMLPAPGITEYPPDPRPNIDYDLSATSEGDIWKVTPSADGMLHIQWRRASRCGGHDDPTPYITISREDGAVLTQIKADSEVDFQHIHVGTAPVLISVAALEGKTFFPEMYLGDTDWIVTTPAGSYFFDPRDPWPYWDFDTNSPTAGQCVPGAPQ